MLNYPMLTLVEVVRIDNCTSDVHLISSNIIESALANFCIGGILKSHHCNTGKFG